MSAAEMPMFPLGNVLFPTMILPLRIFEPRYREMIRVCLEGQPEFGVCLIERGREVGGGDQRSSVGTVAHVLEAQELPDGQWRVVAVGTRRIVVDEWLSDDPYPRALVSDWADPPVEEVDLADLTLGRNRSIELLRQALAYQTELGEPGPPATVQIDDDPVRAGYQIAGLAPIGAFDRHQVLAAASPLDRYALLDDLLTDVVELLNARLTFE